MPSTSRGRFMLFFVAMVRGAMAVVVVDKEKEEADITSNKDRARFPRVLGDDGVGLSWLRFPRGPCGGVDTEEEEEDEERGIPRADERTRPSFSFCGGGGGRWGVEGFPPTSFSSLVEGVSSSSLRISIHTGGGEGEGRGERVREACGRRAGRPPARESGKVVDPADGEGLTVGGGVVRVSEGEERGNAGLSWGIRSFGSFPRGLPASLSSTVEARRTSVVGGSDLPAVSFLTLSSLPSVILRVCSSLVGVGVVPRAFLVFAVLAW